MKIGTVTPHRQFRQNYQTPVKQSFALNNAIMYDTVSFGKTLDEKITEETEPKTKRQEKKEAKAAKKEAKRQKKKHRFAPKAFLALISAYVTFAAFKGTQYMVDEAEKIIEAYKAMAEFKEDPAAVAETFIEDFALDRAFTTKEGGAAYIYTSHPGSSADVLNSYGRTNSSIAFIYNSEDGLQSAALDLDSDGNPEITVKPAEEGYKVFYDLNSDGKTDFTSAEEGEIE